MDENRDTSGLPDPGFPGVEAAIAWQAARFPQVAASLGDLPAGFVVADLLSADGGLVDAMLLYQTRFADGMDARTQGAHLISFYCHHLSIAAGAIYLKTGFVPDFERLALQFGPYSHQGAHPVAQALPADAQGFHFHFRQCVRSDDSVSVFHDLFVESLNPLLKAIQQRTGLSPVAQWRLAADGLAGAFLEIGAALDEEERAMAAALAITDREGSPLFSPVLRFERITGVRDGIPVERIFRLRSGCCLYYRTEGGDFCDVCVLLDDETKRGRLRAHIERAGSLR